jgi:cyclase
MLRPRIIPCLLIHNKGLVKTVQFGNPKYLGDPINAVRIFNEKESDELMVIDIDASVENREPDYKVIENIAAECRMPLCYGGGVKTVEQAQRIFSLGVEKIAISSAAVDNPTLVSEMADRVGNQSVVVVIDVKKKRFGGYDLFINNGEMKKDVDPFEFAHQMEKLGAGEIVVNSIDHDGVMKGYDFELINRMRKSITLPLTVLGGAGSLEDIGKVIKQYGVIGVAAGSLFVFKGVYKAVLINYPNWDEKDKLIDTYFEIK